MQINPRKYILVFILTCFIFFTAFSISNFLNNKKINQLKSIEDKISIDILSLETQFSLFEEIKCSQIGKNALSSELNTLSDKLTYAEEQKGIADDKSNQHKGIGTMLLNEAEKIALKHNYTKIAVISGVGVREYYKKKGYRREGTFMIKTIPKMSLVKTNPLFINSSFETLFVKSLLYTSMIGMTLFGFM
jgi:hypothetical protein